MIWRSGEDPNRTVSVFARAMGTPEADRNLIDFSLNAGLVLHEPFTYRDDDTFGIGMGYAQVSRQRRRLDRDVGAYHRLRSIRCAAARPMSRRPTSIRSRPGGNCSRTSSTSSIPAPASPIRTSRRKGVKNELVVGARTNILF